MYSKFRILAFFPTTAFLCCVLLSVSAHASVMLTTGTNISLTADAANSTPGGFGTSLPNTLTDAFAYDPVTLAADPDQSSFTLANPASAYHTNVAGDALLNYTLNHTVSASEPYLVADLWGRTPDPSFFDRDDNFDIFLLDSAGNVVSSVNGSGIDDTNALTGKTQFGRVSFGALTPGTTITDLQIVAHDSEPSNSSNFFTLQEIRLASGVPEPSSTLLLSLGILGLVARRRK